MNHKTYMSYMIGPESFANLMVTFCHKESFLLMQLIKSTKQRFVREGGFRESLFRERLKYRKENGGK